MTDCKSCVNVVAGRAPRVPDRVVNPAHFGPVLYAHSCSPHVSKVLRFGFGKNYLNFGNGNFKEFK